MTLSKQKFEGKMREIRPKFLQATLAYFEANRLQICGGLLPILAVYGFAFLNSGALNRPGQPSKPYGTVTLYAPSFLRSRAPASERLTQQTASQKPIVCVQKSPTLVKKTLTLAGGHTLVGLLSEVGFSADASHSVVTALKPLINPKELKAGQEIQVTYLCSVGRQPTLETLSFSPAMGLELQVSATKEGFKAKKVHYQLRKRQVAVEGTIEVSLYQDALRQGVDPVILHKMIRVLGQKFDFQRDFQKGDKFKIFYETVWDEKRDQSRPETFLFTSITVGGVPHKFYQFKRPNQENPEFFDENGKALRQTFMRTPVDGARLSSPFGARRHPILGYTKMHKGLDFAAPKGTPIFSAADGVIERASFYGAYGNYVLIRHGNGYHTAYAHLSRYGTGIRTGGRVRQGQVIGHIGTTGRSTGPHLHFELLKNRKQINPKAIAQIPSQVLAGKDLRAFKDYVQKMSRAYLVQLKNGQGVG